jgi:hypothetical protein
MLTREYEIDDEIEEEEKEEMEMKWSHVDV